MIFITCCFIKYSDTNMDRSISMLFPTASRNLKAHRGKAIPLSDRAIMPKTPRQKSFKWFPFQKDVFSFGDSSCSLTLLHIALPPQILFVFFHSKHASKHTVPHTQYVYPCTWKIINAICCTTHKHANTCMNGCNHIIQSNRLWIVIEVLWWNRSWWKRFTSFKICRCPHILEIVHVNDIYDGRHNPSLILPRTTNNVRLCWQYKHTKRDDFSHLCYNAFLRCIW